MFEFLSGTGCKEKTIDLQVNSFEASVETGQFLFHCVAKDHVDGREAVITAGIKTINGFKLPQDSTIHFYHLGYGVALSFLANEAYPLFRKVIFNIPVPIELRQWLATYLSKVNSSMRNFADLQGCNFEYSSLVVSAITLANLPKSDLSSLDINHSVLGASGGKESLLNRIILDKAGYKVKEVTFTKCQNEFDPNAIMSMVWTHDNADEAKPLNLPVVNPIASKMFDYQSPFGVMFLAMAGFVGLAYGCGTVSVGAEFGMSKIWYPAETGLKEEVHDLGADESQQALTWIEDFFKIYGVNLQVISPVGCLHELGIIRALSEHFPITELKSCWMAQLLQTNYCGQCLKCQRIKHYMGILDKQYPERGYGNMLKYDDIGLASGSMLSYSVQYHLTDDYPDLPWASAIIADDTSLRMLDYRNGNKILKVLVNELGFKDTIYPGLLENKLELRLLDAKEVLAKIKDYLGVDYGMLMLDNQTSLHNVNFWLPFEDIVYNLAYVHEFAEELADTWTNKLIISRFDAIPVYDAEKDEWKYLMLTENFTDPKILPLPEGFKDRWIFKTWMNLEGFLTGLYHLNLKSYGYLPQPQ